MRLQAGPEALSHVNDPPCDAELGFAQTAVRWAQEGVSDEGSLSEAKKQIKRTQGILEWEGESTPGNF